METPLNILVIEDDPSINEVVCAHLERQGHRCTAAFSGTEGTLQAAQHPFDLVITDLMLPGITGEEIVRAIRAADGALPIIVISARITPADKIALLELGADDYLTKPFDLDELSARVAVQRRHHVRSAGGEGAGAGAMAGTSLTAGGAGGGTPSPSPSACSTSAPGP